MWRFAFLEHDFKDFCFDTNNHLTSENLKLSSLLDHLGLMWKKQNKYFWFSEGP